MSQGTVEDVISEMKRKIQEADPAHSGSRATIQVGDGPKADLDSLIKGTAARIEGEKASRKRRAKATEPPGERTEFSVDGKDYVAIEEGGLDGVDTGQTMREHGQGAAGEWFRFKSAEALLSPIRKHHPHLDHAYIIVLSGPIGGAQDGCKVLGRARRLKKTERALLKALDVPQNPDYVIEVDTEQWAILDNAQRVALLDHELCHMAGREIDAEGNLGDWKLRGHDLEEFTPVVQRHGIWRPSIQDFARAVQAYLPGMDKIG